MTLKRQAIVDQFRAVAQSCLNTAQDLETSAVLTLDPKERKGFDEQAASYRRRADSFSRARGLGQLRRMAIRVAREALRESNMDEQAAEFDLLNTDDLEPWFHVLKDPEDMMMGVIRFASWQLGERT